MGLPSGVMWSPVNIDVERAGGFAKSPFQYDCSFFSWGNVDGHNPASPSSFSPWDWGGVNSQSPYYQDQIYGSTPGVELMANIEPFSANDPATVNCGRPWRLPSWDDFIELLANTIFINADGSEVDQERADKRVVVNEVVGIYLQSKINGARLFLACAGYGSGSILTGYASNALYLTSTFYTARDCRSLYVTASSVNAGYNARRYQGIAVRPVMEL